MELLLPILKALFSLVLILFACELFTNAIEWVGSRYNLSHGAVGSVLAAVGTALPETLVPIVAILFIGNEAAHEVGIGGILGAPFMLATLAFAVTGISAIVYAKRRPQGLQMKVDVSTLEQDFSYFFVVYIIAVSLSPALQWLHHHIGKGSPIESIARYVIAGFLFLAYAYYVYRHFKRPESQEEEEGIKNLYFQPNSTTEPRLRFIFGQIIVSLAVIIEGAHLFVNNLTVVSDSIGISPLILSLIITPIATELPEKFNSILWVRQGKDTLALGNISGAMVFQSCIPVAVGVTMTDWALNIPALTSVVVALVSTAIVASYMYFKKQLSATILLVGIPLYCIFLYVAFSGFASPVPH